MGLPTACIAAFITNASRREFYTSTRPVGSDTLQVAAMLWQAICLMLSCAMQMSSMLTGRIDIQYRRVQCTPPSNLIVNIDQNSGTGGFLKMSVTVSFHNHTIQMLLLT